MPTQYTPGQLGMATPFGELLGNSDAEMNAELDDYAALGIDFVRTDFWWDLAKPTSSSAYDWTLMDKVVNAANSRGIEVVGILNGNPNWVADDMSTSAAKTAFADFASAAANHFNGRVDNFEILNEANTEGISPANYTQVLQGAYNAIKAVQPDSTVITSGLASVPSTGNGLWGANDYLQQIYANGGKNYFDAVGHHPYSYPLMPSDTSPWNGWQIMEDDMRATMVANGDSAKDIWMTEFGAPTEGDPGENWVYEEVQADMIEEAASLAHGYSWSGPLMLYSYKDRGGDLGDTENWFGAVRADGWQKPSYDSIAAIAGADDPPPVEAPTFTTQNFTGTLQADYIVGNDMDNLIDGVSANDTLKGGAGNDRLIGNNGTDTLWGGTGNDEFDFNTIPSIVNDQIMDFETGDKINLWDLDANSVLTGNQAFTFIGSNWLANAGNLGVYPDAGANHTSVQGDVNGDGAPDFNIIISGLRPMTASDFVL